MSRDMPVTRSQMTKPIVKYVLCKMTTIMLVTWIILMVTNGLSILLVRFSTKLKTFFKYNI